MELSEERARARELWRAKIAEMIADNSKSKMREIVQVEPDTEDPFIS